MKLRESAHSRTGDKGNIANIGVIALRPDCYSVLVNEVTPERVKEHFGDVCYGPVERFEMPNLNALNFLLHDSLDGGGTISLRTDAQGKTYGGRILSMEIDVPENLL